MKISTISRQYRDYIIATTGLLIFVVCLFPHKAWCGLPGLTFGFSTSENIIVNDPTAAIKGVSVTCGGGIVNADIGGKQAVMVVSFGQAFSGTAFYPTAINDLMSRAKENHKKGSKFLDYPSIYKMGTLCKDEPGYLDTLLFMIDGQCTSTYDEQALWDAEQYYRYVLFMNPFTNGVFSSDAVEAVKGILRVRMARVLKYNLVWDIRQREQLRLRLTSSDTGKDILKNEIQILDEINGNEKTAIAWLLQLFSDPTPGGPGALLRGEPSITFSDSEPNLRIETLKLLYSSGRRLAETEIALANKRTLLNFFNEGDNADSRKHALEELANAHAYLSELVKILTPFTDNSIYENSEVLILTSLQRKQSELINFIQQGYNSFGFLPDFVPFVVGGMENNNLSTFNKMYEIAVDAATITSKKEEDAKTKEEKFAQNSDEYLQRIQDVETRYAQRLKTLIGVVAEDGEEFPDVFTFLIPDKDLDGDGISERDKERAKFNKEYGFEFKSKGEIGLQYETIASAENSIEMALNDLSNNLKAIEIREETARAILGIQGEIAMLIRENGTKVGVLMREKGKLQKKAYQETADKQRRSSLSGWMWQGGNDLANKLKESLGSNAAAFSEPFPDNKPSVTVAPAVIAAIVAAAGVVLSNVDSVIGSQAAGDISEIQGQLAEDMANVDAEINEIQSLTNATIELARGRQELLRTEQEVKLLVLDQANLGLALEMKRRDSDREMMALMNMIAEAHTLLIDRSRTIKLMEKSGDHVLGWQEEDVRDVLTNAVLVADKAFSRAQVWTFIALRALEYYANRPPDTSGQPDTQIRSLYEDLYSARRGEDLLDLLNEMAAKAKSDFVFTLTSVSCPGRAILSLKYDVLVPTVVAYGNGGLPVGVDRETHYRYMDPFNGQTYEGAKAYQAAFRNALRQGLTGEREKGNRKLTLIFGTDLFPRMPSGGMAGSNPFYVASATNAKIIGFTNPNCAGPGLPENAQGLQINATGKLDGLSTGPMVQLAQAGNSYLKHTQWYPNDFDEQGRLKEPLKSVTVYSAYKQILPTWLIGDIDDDNPTAEEDKIGSAVVALLRALRNGQGDAGKTLAFTDRAVANDRWELVIWEKEDMTNTTFLNKIEEMLKGPISDSPGEDFLTDIQLWTGWAYRNPN